MLRPLQLNALHEQPLVSILIASYNYEAYIEEALRSAQTQTYTNLEIIVCDDGSTDDSCSIVSRYAAEDTRIRLLRQENAGVAAALNNAYSESRGAVICLLDADDTFQQDKVARVIQKMASDPLMGFVQHSMKVIDDAGRMIRRLPAHNLFEEGWIAGKLIARGGRWRNMPASALSFRREIAKILFPMPVANLKSMADAYLYILAPLLTKTGFITEPLSSYRLHGANLTGTLHFDRNISSKYTAGMLRVQECIAAVVKERGLEMPALDVNQHLTYLEHQFMQGLFEEKSRRELWRMYSILARRIKADDLYPYVRKLLGRFVLGAAVFMPASLRPAWVTWGMGGWRR